MPAITADEKTKGKRAIVKIVAPSLVEAGFRKEGTYDFSFATEAGVGRLILNFPRYDSEVRMLTSFEGKEGRLQGPLTLPFCCPNPPGGRRYYFRFTHVEDTYPRCAKEVTDWVSMVLVPWFKSAPKTGWTK
jgi:hypothetical protein